MKNAKIRPNSSSDEDKEKYIFNLLFDGNIKWNMCRNFCLMLYMLFSLSHVHMSQVYLSSCSLEPELKDFLDPGLAKP